MITSTTRNAVQQRERLQRKTVPEAEQIGTYRDNAHTILKLTASQAPSAHLRHDTPRSTVRDSQIKCMYSRANVALTCAGKRDEPQCAATAHKPPVRAEKIPHQTLSCRGVSSLQDTMMPSYRGAPVICHSCTAKHRLYRNNPLLPRGCHPCRMPPLQNATPAGCHPCRMPPLQNATPAGCHTCRMPQSSASTMTEYVRSLRLLRLKATAAANRLLATPTKSISLRMVHDEVGFRLNMVHCGSHRASGGIGLLQWTEGPYHHAAVSSVLSVKEAASDLHFLQKKSIDTNNHHCCPVLL
eukprot:1160146-Pelagomonas_calceolata.AAC.21